MPSLPQFIHAASHSSVPTTNKFDDSYAPWLRICMVLVPDFAFIFATLILCATRRFHPITALIAAIILLGLYVTAALFNCLAVLSCEVYFEAIDTWSNICYAEVGVQGVIGILYIAMAVYAGKAVHRWRKARGGALSGTEEFGMEAANGKAADARRFP
jgi:hypothetical protein